MSTIIPTEAQWEAIKICSIRGVPDSEIATQFNVNPASIRNKRRRDELWKAAVNTTRAAKKPTQSDTKAAIETVVETVSANLEHIAQENPVMVANYAHKALKEAFESGMVPTPSTWADVSAATKLVRQAVGLDREGQVNVQVGIWGGQYEAFDGPTVDV